MSQVYTPIMKTPEYTEGPQALENFKSLATAILQANPEKKKQAPNPLLQALATEHPESPTRC
jgi:hypothetical protein